MIYYVWFYVWLDCIGKCMCMLAWTENPALPANIEFELEAILSIQVVFQLNSDYCTTVVITGGLHCIILNCEAWLCYYKGAITLNSQAGQ